MQVICSSFGKLTKRFACEMLGPELDGIKWDEFSGLPKSSSVMSGPPWAKSDATQELVLKWRDGNWLISQIDHHLASPCFRFTAFADSEYVHFVGRQSLEAPRFDFVMNWSVALFCEGAIVLHVEPCRFATDFSPDLDKCLTRFARDYEARAWSFWSQVWGENQHSNWAASRQTSMIPIWRMRKRHFWPKFKTWRDLQLPPVSLAVVRGGVTPGRFGVDGILIAIYSDLVIHTFGGMTSSMINCSFVSSTSHRCTRCKPPANSHIQVLVLQGNLTRGGN